MIIHAEFRFEASHVLPLHEGKCSRLHGHSWVLRVSIRGPVNEKTGFVVDYKILKALVNKLIIDRFDHQHLGQGDLVGDDLKTDRVYRAAIDPDFYPSSENLVQYIASQLSQPISDLGLDIELYEVSLKETCTCEATVLLGKRHA
jgi:6-pyruvoyltetrahydropterin/6-carboxytetrahydropterin synthase